MNLVAINGWDSFSLTESPDPLQLLFKSGEGEADVGGCGGTFALLELILSDVLTDSGTPDPPPRTFIKGNARLVLVLFS